MKTHLVLFATALTVYSCGNSESEIPSKEHNAKSRLEIAEWLLGSWENNSEQGRMTETWIKDNENAYTAKTYFIVGQDTVFRELSKLEETGDNLQCVISVEGQNDEKPVTFTMTSQDERSMVFENPTHDFPQKITYEQKGDSVIAVISGKQEGKPAKERFAMVRVK